MASKDRGLTPIELSGFCSEIALMLGAGMPLYAGMEALEKTYEQDAHADLYHKVSETLTQTGSLRDALEETHAFPTYLVEMCGIGERTGNVPLEAMVFEYASLRGSLDGMDTTVITEIADYFKNEIGYKIPPLTPFVGSAFNVTRAGVHADGLMKDEEIYTIFDTKKILNKPATVQISKTSGLAGIAYWINQTYGLEDGEKLDKKSPLVIAMKEWVDQQYEDGRQTVMTERELKEKIRQLAPDFAERG